MDSVDRWSEQRIWDAALDQCRIIVSTHAVLADALQHGFVRISSLALLIFDEGILTALPVLLISLKLVLNDHYSPSLRKETSCQRHYERFLLSC